MIFVLVMIAAYCFAGTLEYEDRVRSLTDMTPTEGWYMHDN